MSDGFLEFTSAHSVIGMGLGNFCRIGQAKGPFKFSFSQQYPGDTEENVMYLDIDGEYFKAENIKSIFIEPATELESYSIKVQQRRSTSQWNDNEQKKLNNYEKEL